MKMSTPNIIMLTGINVRLCVSAKTLTNAKIMSVTIQGIPARCGRNPPSIFSLLAETMSVGIIAHFRLNIICAGTKTGIMEKMEVSLPVMMIEIVTNANLCKTA